jgi:hypothetical protein
VLAGKNESGAAILISCFRNGHGKITMELDSEPEHCELFTLDEQHDLEPVPLVCNGNVIEIDCNSDSTVQLLKLFLIKSRGRNHIMSGILWSTK